MSIRSFLAAITVLTSALVGVPAPVRGASITLFPSADYTERVSLRIVDLARTGNQICFKFAAVAGKSYAVERKDALTPGDWVVIQNFPTVPNPGLISVCDPLAAGPAFYRLAER